MGDLRRGIQLANNNPSKSVKKECGEILDKMKQYKEAGELFIKAECWEKGAASYLRAKLLNKVRAEHFSFFEILVFAITSSIFRILTEHIDKICSLESELFLITICYIRILKIIEVIE